MGPATAQAQSAAQGGGLDATLSGATLPMTRQMAATIAVGAGQKAGGQGATVTSRAGTIVAMTGAGPATRDVGLVGGAVPGGTTVIGVDIANTHGSSLREVSVDLDGSTGQARPAFNLTGNIVDHMSMAVSASTPGYAYLTNDELHSTNTMDGHVLIGFNLVSGTADAIEYNNPGAPMKHNVTWGGILDAGRNGIGPQAGLAFGVAHNQGWVAGGFVTRYARTAGAHIEDGSSFGVLSSVSLRGCQLDGIWATVFGNNIAEATPIVITGFAAEGPGKGKVGSHGVYLAYNATGFCSRWPILGGYVKDFDVGLNLDGLGTVPATSVTVDDCNTVLQTASGRHYGTLFSNRSGALFAVRGAGGARAGTFVQTDSAPVAIIANRPGGGHVPRSTVEGFAFPVLGSGAVSVPPGAGAMVDLFQAPVRMRGRLRIVQAGPGGGLFWEAEICCLDGRTVGVVDEPLYDASGVVAIGGVQVAAFTASIAGNRMDVSGVSSGVLGAGQVVTGAGAGTKILRQMAGAPGGVGSYLVDVIQTFPGTAMGSRSPLVIVDGRVQLQLFNAGRAMANVRGVQIEFNGTFYA